MKPVAPNPIRKRRKRSTTDALLTPSIFVEAVLDKPLYGWQRKAVDPLKQCTGPHGKMTQIAVCAPNEGGKSSRIVTGASLWWLTVHRKGKVVITTKDAKQLNEQILPAIEDGRTRFEGWNSVKSPYYKLTTPTGGRLIAYVTDEAGRVEGMHSGDKLIEPLMYITDEAKSIGEDIFQGIDRCSYQALLMCSSPGLMQGTFYNAFTKNRAQFVTIQAGLKDCPHISQEKQKRVIDKWGIDHPFTQSTLFGKFMEQDDATQFVVTLSSLERCRANPPAHKPGFKMAFCDFAGGGAENVICLRNGNKYTIEATWKDADKMRSVGRFIQHFRRLGLVESQIIGDAADAEMIKLLRDSGWAIGTQNFGAPANESDAYSSWSAEAWIEGAVAIEKCEVILPDDEELFSQLTTRKKLFTARGKIGVEEKYMMRKRAIPSPDRADALFGVMSQRDYSAMYGKSRLISSNSWLDDFKVAQQSRFLDRIGANAGL